MILNNLKKYISILLKGWASLAFVLLPILSLGQAAKDTSEFKVYYYQGGAKSSEGTLVNGKPNGYWKSYWRNGNLKTEGNRLNYELDSLWKFYNEEGQITAEITYQKGQKNGLSKVYTEGQVVKITPYRQDKIVGVEQYFYSGGKLKKEVPYEAGKSSGTGFIYAQTDGRIVTLLTYKANKLVRKQAINQLDEQSQKQGLWMQFYPNRQTKVEGPYVNDLKNGYWKYYQSNGNLIRVEKWIMGVLQEGAKEASKVEIKRTLNPNTGKLASKGAYRDGEPVGVHREYNDKGEVTSAKIYENGEVLYEGIIDEQGRKQGPWKHFFPGGKLKAKGRYRDDLKVAEWEYYYAQDQGREQIGSYVKGKPDGEWIWYHPNKELWRVENYFNGLEDGPSVEYNDTGAVITQGNYIEGYREGKWTLQLNDHREEGKYFEGQRTGTWRSYYLENDQLRFEGQYENGVKNGNFTYYYADGQIRRRGQYLADKRHGLWEFFTPEGERIITIEYENGEELKYNGEKIKYGKRYDREVKREKERQAADEAASQYAR